MLVSNRNLLVIADVLAVNKGFAKAQPEDGGGPRARHPRGQPPLRDNQTENIGIVAKAFSWTDAEARDELSHVHLVQPAGEPARSSPARSIPPARSAASFSLRCSPMAA